MTCHHELVLYTATSRIPTKFVSMEQMFCLCQMLAAASPRAMLLALSASACPRQAIRKAWAMSICSWVDFNTDTSPPSLDVFSAISTILLRSV